MRGMRAVAAALGAVVALGACGGGGGERLSKADYIKQADAICKAATAATDKVAAPDSEEGLPEYVGEIAKVADKMLKDLRALNGPAADEKTVDAIYDGYDQALKMITDDPSALMTLTESPFTEVEKQAQAYGFEECGSE